MPDKHSQLHSCLLLSATREEPSHTPLSSVPTHVPFKLYFPLPQMMQSLDEEPVQV